MRVGANLGTDPIGLRLRENNVTGDRVRVITTYTDETGFESREIPLPAA